MTKPSDSRTTDTAGHQSTSASEFDRLFGSEAHDSTFTTIARLVDPDLPPGLDLFSFLCADLLHHVARQLDLHRQHVLADLGCGRGGPGLWLVSASHASVIGIDFSAVAIDQARHRAEGLPVDASFAVADLSSLPLADHCVDRVLSLDALQYAPDRADAARQALRTLKPGGRLVLTGWHPRTPGDERLPERHRHTDWLQVLRTAGFTDVHCASAPGWDAAYQGIYRTALTMQAEAGSALAGLQGEARRRPPTAHLLRRVAVTADRG
ncbi:class I SAM-dependent methyltransferase [Streptomyces canus]|uniref:class I SAM-dependent methyltransferase n=1 Tax=Streptomyces canus TaxID=58343 RepID=UPI00225A511C|nr:class I SAM-dependent methyltransferase [Streptomyces canus]MCX4853706.1 methyltransferase domain-containing protein [Streptomyces canus]